MRRKWLAIILVCILVSSTASAYVWLELKPASGAPTLAPKIGTFYYLWYGALANDWKQPKFVDYPIIGNYSSCDPVVIREQLTLMQNAGIDFAVISWWGFYDAYGNFIDNATRQVFETAQAMNSSLKFAVMVEAFNQTGSLYDYDSIYNYVYDNFVAPHHLLYLTDGKPVICFFNNQNLTYSGNMPKDPRFNVITVGQQSYTQWIYTDVNKYDLPQHEPLNQTSVTPRYDESNLPDRPGNVTVDINLNQGTYDNEWTNAIELWKQGKIDIILISSWNEYPERTAIEPHYDATSSNTDPYFLYNKTHSYISQIRQLAAANYLQSHFNENLGLVYESEETGPNINAPGYRHNQTYFIYSDNLLADWALKPYYPKVSQIIEQEIQSYGLPPSDFFDVLFGKTISEPLCNGLTTNVTSDANSIILAEFRNYSDPIQGQYANAQIYRSLNNYLKGDMNASKGNFTEALNLWDGKGINDNATKADHKYANYKLALILYASKVLGIDDPRIQEIEQKLWSMQQTNGGITSLADLDGKPVGSANAETTSMALLPYNTQLISEMQALFGKGA